MHGVLQAYFKEWMDMNDNSSVFEEFLSWFDLKKYIGTNEFGVEQWYFVLRRRRAVLDAIEKDKESAARMLTHVLSTPLYDGSGRDQPTYDPSVTDLNACTAWCMRNVVEAFPDIADACRYEDDWPPPDNSAHEVGTEAWWQDIVREGQSDYEKHKMMLLSKSYNELLLPGSDSPNYAYLVMDLSAPDEIIMNDFKDWLNKIRSNSKFSNSPVKRISKSEMSKWAQNRILPYLDIYLVANHLGASPTNYKYGCALFPDMEVDVSEKIRKTVSPLADKLLSYDMLDALALAANDARRQRLAEESS